MEQYINFIKENLPMKSKYINLLIEDFLPPDIDIEKFSILGKATIEKFVYSYNFTNKKSINYDEYIKNNSEKFNLDEDTFKAYIAFTEYILDEASKKVGVGYGIIYKLLSNLITKDDGGGDYFINTPSDSYGTGFNIDGVDTPSTNYFDDVIDAPNVLMENIMGFLPGGDVINYNIFTSNYGIVKIFNYTIGSTIIPIKEINISQYTERGGRYIASNNSFIVCVSNDASVLYIYDIANNNLRIMTYIDEGENPLTHMYYEFSINKIEFLPDGRSFVIFMKDIVLIYDLNGNKINSIPSGVLDFSLSNNGQLFVLYKNRVDYYETVYTENSTNSIIIDDWEDFIMFAASPNGDTYSMYDNKNGYIKLFNSLGNSIFLEYTYENNIPYKLKLGSDRVFLLNQTHLIIYSDIAEIASISYNIGDYNMYQEPLIYITSENNVFFDGKIYNNDGILLQNLMFPIHDMPFSIIENYSTIPEKNRLYELENILAMEQKNNKRI